MEKSTVDIAVLLLAVGMGTVFVMLGLVALSSRILISMTNRWAPELPALKPEIPNNPDPGDITEEEMAVVLATVHLITNGQGFPATINKGDITLKN